jgi:hypothetical protein
MVLIHLKIPNRQTGKKVKEANRVGENARTNMVNVENIGNEECGS